MAKKARRFTEEELDAMLGRPEFFGRCSHPRCPRETGRYYTRANAMAALAQRQEWGHLRTLGSTVVPRATQAATDE